MKHPLHWRNLLSLQLNLGVNYHQMQRWKVYTQRSFSPQLKIFMLRHDKHHKILCGDVLVLFWDIPLQVLVHHLSNPSLYEQNLGTLVLSGAVSVIPFTAAPFAMVFSCCFVLLTKESSPNLIAFSASFFICMALSWYIDSLAGSSVISFQLLDTILRQFLRFSRVISSSCSLKKGDIPTQGPLRLPLHLSLWLHLSCCIICGD